MNALNSPKHNEEKSGRTKRRGVRDIVPAAVSAALCALLVVLAGLSSAPQKNWASWGRHEKQYEELTAALAAGQLALSEAPAEFLAELENPYDPAARSIAAAENDAYALIDTAYYGGKYYVYFGVTPALLSFLPAKLLTGRTPPTWLVVILTAALCVPAAFLFVRALCARFFPRSRMALRLLLSALLIGALGTPYLATFCTSYSMPAVLGLLLMLLGLSCFLGAERTDGSMRRPLLVLGAALLALTIGCRPVFAVSFLLLFPIFSDAIGRGAFFRREKASLTNTVAIVLPALALGCSFLLYNALRFDNPLEFGFRYLLTTRDLSRGAHGPGETLAGAGLLLLRMPTFRRVFPFIEIFDYSGRYQDVLYVEPLFGGLLPLHPFLPAGLLLGALLLVLLMRRSPRKDEAVAARQTAQTPAASSRALRALALCSLLLGAGILLTDAAIAGISQRYESDFALFFFLPAAIAFLRAQEALAEAAAQAPLRHAARLLPALLALLLLLLAVAEILLTSASILCDGRYFAMRDWNPAVYNRIAAFFR